MSNEVMEILSIFLKQSQPKNSKWKSIESIINISIEIMLYSMALNCTQKYYDKNFIQQYYNISQCIL